jgi:nucleotide-binding universal stress UspA family protein
MSDSDQQRPVIVVGVDGSESSRDAAHWAMKQAAITGSEVRAVSSWRWPNYLSRLPPGVDLQRETAETLEEIVEEAGADVGGVKVTTHVVEGPAGPALLVFSKGASLLVVGARGRAAFPGMLLGSVAEYCVRNGSCPVVVVRANLPPT